MITLHIGPTNSGKTYNSLEYLKNNGGVYLAPLRLLAWEVYDKLNSQGIPCSLLTGEEREIKEDDKVISCTVEMFDSSKHYPCIVLDECQLIADHNRGFAWLNVLLNCKTDHLHIICSVNAEKLIGNILNDLGKSFNVQKYKRLTPLKVSKECFKLDEPVENTVYIAFSRRSVLNLRDFFLNQGITASVIYGNLPPDVRRKQAERFLSGENKICIATDSIGLGMNLPAKNICFVEVTKFDGEIKRNLNTSEILQIAGRAGRYGMFDFGTVTTTSKKDLKFISKHMRNNQDNLSVAYIGPTFEDIDLIKKDRLLDRFIEWEKNFIIPKEIIKYVKKVSLEEKKYLSYFISKEQEYYLGLKKCFTLSQVPTTKQSEEFWKLCLKSICRNNTLPIPKVNFNGNLNDLETSIKECDVYIYIGIHPVFKDLDCDISSVQNMRYDLATKVDEILAKDKAVSGRLCRMCKEALPFDHPFGICENCYEEQYHYNR